MTHTPRRALLGALLIAPIAATAAHAATPESLPSDRSWLELHARWRAACSEYASAVRAQEGVEAIHAAIPTPQSKAADDRAYEHAKVWALRCRRLAVRAAMKPANDYAALSIKLDMIADENGGAGLDMLAKTERPHWQRLVSEIHAAVRQARVNA